MVCLETVPVGWRAGGGLTDMAVASSYNQLIGASISQSLVTTYVADIKSCVPFVSPPSSSNPSSPPGIIRSTGSNLRSNFEEVCPLLLCFGLRLG